MPKTYDTAPSEVQRRAEALIDKYHPETRKAEVTIDYVFAFNPEGDAITHGGYPALGLCRIVNLKDRSKGMSDVEITLDGAAWKEMSAEQRDALLDHELHHIVVKYDEAGCLITDDLNRPKIKMRKHDYDFGWFKVIAERHGMASPEVTQARRMMLRDGQLFWPELAGKIIDAEEVE